MSKLDELLRELCPDGVEYVRLGTLCSLITKQTGFDYTKHIKARLLMEPAENAVPYIQTKFFAGKNFNYQTDYYVPMDIVEQFPKITLDEKCILFSIVGASIGNVGLFPGERKCFLGGAICVAKVLPQYDVDYIYYCVEAHNVQHQIRRKTKGAGQATITVEDIREFEIPLPPIEIQSEIVRILDNFTNLTAELVKELTARKTQYNYYRDYLLSYKDNVKKYTIAELADTNIGLATSVTQHKRNSGVVLIHNSDIQPNKVVLKSIEYVSEEFAEKNKKKVLRKGDIITVHTGDVGTSAVIDDAFDGAIGFTTITTRIRDRKEITPEYLCHYLNSHQCKRDIESMTISDRNNLNQKSYEKLTVPVPPLDVQNRIVNVLDNFEKICSDLNIGLPAEIEARQKQYEYYRDKLLTFAETGNTILSRAEQSRAEQSRAEH